MSTGRFTNIRVIDGDSVEGNYKGERVRVRLYAIDAPELGQPGGAECAEHLSRMIGASGAITLEVVDVDRYGRKVGLLYPAASHRRNSLNARMVREGFAYAFTNFGGAELGVRVAEMDARESRRGVCWTDSVRGGVRPWKYRREQTGRRRGRDAQRGAPASGRGVTIVFAVLLLIAVVLWLIDRLL